MHEHEILVLKELGTRKGACRVEELAPGAKLPVDAVRRAAGLLRDRGYATIEEKRIGNRTSLTPEGENFLYNGFPEERIIAKLRQSEKALALSKLDDAEKSIGLGWAKKQGALLIGKDGLQMQGLGLLPKTEEQKKMLDWVKKHDGFVSEVVHPVLKELISRGLLSELKQEREQMILITPHGTKALHSGSELKAGYNLTAPVARQYPAKPHPVQRMTDRIRRIFFELGFEEMAGSAVESAFWNFDALFQPQDHPARDMADTFYVKGEADRKDLPDAEIVDKVVKAHQMGWKYKWSEQEARKKVLRTHTTAVSARYLVKSRSRDAAKFFCVGRVYRNEAVDFKHLAEFNQIEGIVLWEDATFGNLLGLLREFYRKLGFEKIRFRPSYFPYTEPSVEVEVYFEKKKAWLELGGAGVFRPEVCMPLWGKYPVLAWGLSLERPIMLANEIDDIRKFYANDVAWLRDFKLKD